MSNRSNSAEDAPQPLLNGGKANGYCDVTVSHWDGRGRRTRRKNNVEEEPLSIRIQGKPYSVIMRTPGNEMAHAAALFNENFELLASAEDVGRHNALDKVIGQLFLEKRLTEACLLVLSSRISYELVQKAARVKIPIVLAVSRPTAIAVTLADHLNMTLACLASDRGLYIFTGRDRLKTSLRP